MNYVKKLMLFLTVALLVIAIQFSGLVQAHEEKTAEKEPYVAKTMDIYEAFQTGTIRYLRIMLV